MVTESGAAPAAPHRGRYWRRAGVGLTMAALAALPLGCGSGGSGGSATATETDATTSSATEPTSTAVIEPATTVPLDTANFSDPTNIDNPWLPMVPGTQLVLEGQADRGRGPLAHRVSITVTDLTKVVDGVLSRVVWERDVNEGTLKESEIAFFAQDDAGNVWNLGEYPEEYENRRFVGAPSTWLSGLDGAIGGIHVQGAPQTDTPVYLEGAAPSINFLDHAKVAALGAEACAPIGCYQDVLVVDEWDPLDQPADGHQLKQYAPGLGLVRVDPQGGEEQEVLVLVEVNQLEPAALAQAREAAVRLDTRAYEVAPSVWAGSEPVGAG